MRADPQPSPVVHEAVEHVWRFVAGRRHDAHVVGTMLVGNMSVKAQTGIISIASVHVAGGVAPLARSKELPV
jgi:hypothetical protein